MWELYLIQLQMLWASLQTLKYPAARCLVAIAFLHHDLGYCIKLHIPAMLEVYEELLDSCSECDDDDSTTVGIA